MKQIRALLLVLVTSLFLGLFAYPPKLNRGLAAWAAAPQDPPYAVREHRMPAEPAEERAATADTDQSSTLSVDDGSFEILVGLSQSGTIYCVNRLQPVTYPATLSQLQIYFAGGSSHLTPGSSFTLVVGSNTDGNEDISGTSFQQLNASIQGLDQFNTYNVPSLTINSGDFVVGLRMQIPTNVFPGALDTTPPSRRRSYVSTDGFNFNLTENLSNVPAGNFGIRAVANQPSQAAILSVSPNSLTFDAGLNQGNPAPQQLTVTNSGSGFLNFSVGSSDSSLVIVSPSSGTVGVGQSQTVTVFATNPNQAGTRTATLTVSASGAQNSPQVVSVTVNTGSAGTLLSIDDGTFENRVGLAQPGTIYFVNRLQPAAYPATLSQIQIYFLGGSSNLGAGAPITLLFGSNPDGDENINGTSFQQQPANIQGLDRFNTYNAPSITINSGDFLVGFRAQIQGNVFPGALDATPPSHRRSFVSTDGFSYTLTENLTTVPAGDFGIRATISAQAAILSVAPTSMNFNAVLNQGNPPAQQLIVTNAGSGFMTFNISSNDFSLVSVSPSSGTVGSGQSQSVTVFVNNPNQPGTRNAFLTVSAPGAQNNPQTVTVTVTTAGPPAILDVSPASLGFSAIAGQGNPPSQQMTIRNLGSSSFTFNASTSDSGLVNVSPSSGTVFGGQSIAVTVFVNNSNQIGTRQAFLTVNASGAQNSPRSVTVTVNTTSPPAILDVSPTSLNFNAVAGQGTPPAQQITVRNLGSGSFTFNISSNDQSLVSVSPASGTVFGGQSQAITVFVSNPNQAGTRQAFLTINAPGAQNSPRSVTATVNTTSPPAILSVTPTSLSFNAVVNQGNPPAQQMTVTNSGSGFMSFTLSSSDSSLVTVSPAGGSLGAGQSQPITVFANNPNQIGSRNTFLTASASGAQNSPRTVTVTVNTTSPPAILDVTPSSLNFNAVLGQGSPPPQQITVRNLGSGALAFNISGNNPSLVSVSPASGTIFGSQSQTVTVFVNNLNQAGTQQVLLNIDAPGAQNSPRTVAVTVNTTGAPAALNVSPASLTFNAVVGQGDPTPQQITVQNAGGSPLSFTISTSTGSVNASPASGFLVAGQSRPVTVTVTNPNQPGTRATVLTVNAPGAQNSPQLINITINTEASLVQNEDEPNDSPQQAKTLSTPSRGQTLTVRGDARRGDAATTVGQLTSECQNDGAVEDWFRFTATQRDAFRATLAAQSADADFSLFLFMQTSDFVRFPAGVRLLGFSARGAGQDESIGSVVLETGTYFLGVSRVPRSFFSDLVRVNYTVTLTRGLSPELHAIEDSACIGFVATSSSTNGHYVVNRLRPTSYPARLESINVLFSAPQGRPSPNGQQVRIIVFADPSGSGVPPFSPQLLLNQTFTINVPSNGDGQFNTFNLGSNGPVINQGDLYVGYVVETGKGVFINAGRLLDPGLRSFVSSSGGLFYQQINLQDNNGQPLNVAVRPVMNTRPFGTAPEEETNQTQPQEEDDLVPHARPRMIPVDEP